MPGTGALSPERGADEFVTFKSLWTIGATGAHTKTTGVPGRGFTSVARTGAGQYTVQMSDNMPSGPFVQAMVQHYTAASTVPTSTKVNTASWNPATRQFLYENWSEGGTPALTELTNGDTVSIEVTFLKTK